MHRSEVKKRRVAPPLSLYMRTIVYHNIHVFWRYVPPLLCQKCSEYVLFSPISLNILAAIFHLL